MTNLDSANSDNITLPKNEYHQCSQKMLRCAAMSDRGRRESVLTRLPSNITTRISEGNTSSVHVFNIVQSCSQFFGGIDQLVIALYEVEGDTKEWFELENYLRPFALNRQVIPTAILESSQPPLRPPEQPQGHTNTGSGPQFNIGSQQAGRDINQGNTINAQGSQGFINQPSGPITQHFGAPPTVYNAPVHINNTYNQPKGDVNLSGDTFNMTGNFQGAILNIKSTLNHTIQSIGAIPNAQPSDKEQLTALITQLNELLQQVPSDKSAEAQKVAKRADELVIEVTAKELDAEVVESKGNLLLKAAQNIGGALPAVLPVVQQIIAFIGKFL